MHYSHIQIERPSNKGRIRYLLRVLGVVGLLALFAFLLYLVSGLACLSFHSPEACGF